MMRRFQIMVLIVCCAAMPAIAQEEEVPRPGQAVEALPGEQQIELSVSPSAAPAEPTAVEPTAEEPAEEEPSPVPAEMRDPFSPVGYVPPSEAKVASQGATTPGSAVAGSSAPKIDPPQWDLALKSLVIKGVMKSGAGYMAVINGQVTSENDTISAVFKGRTYSWRIAKIGKEGVRFERLELAR